MNHMKSATETVYIKQFIKEPSVPDYGVRSQDLLLLK